MNKFTALRVRDDNGPWIAARYLAGHIDGQWVRLVHRIDGVCDLHLPEGTARTLNHNDMVRLLQKFSAWELSTLLQRSINCGMSTLEQDR